MKRIIYTLGILLSFTTIVFGQGISNYNLYTINQYSINPAYVGSQNGLFTLLHFKNHFTGLTNAPRSLSFVAHSPVGEKLSLGGNITVAQGGVFRTTSANVASSYKVNLATDHRVTFGLSGGFVKQSLDFDKVGSADLSDPTLQASYNDKIYYKFGFGALYQWKNLEVSLAFPNALQEQRNLLSNYFIGFASYKFETADKQWAFKPSLLYKSIPVTKDQVDVYVTSYWRNMLWALTGYRTNKNLLIGGGVTLENLNVGYAYEVPTGTKEVSKGTHEVVLTFLLKKKTAPPALPPSENTLVDQPMHDTTYQHIKDLEVEVENLKRQVGEISHYISVDSVRHSKDSLYTMDHTGKHQKIQRGNYIVVQNCKTQSFADKLVKMYKSKGIDTYILYNGTQMAFYIVEKYFTSFDPARYEMEKMRKKGYKNTWVMVY